MHSSVQSARFIVIFFSFIWITIIYLKQMNEYRATEFKMHNFFKSILFWSKPFHVCVIATFQSVIFSRCFFFSKRSFMICQSLSFGFKSDEATGHSITVKWFRVNQSHVWVAVRSLALSCCKTFIKILHNIKPSPTISQYFIVDIFPLTEINGVKPNLLIPFHTLTAAENFGTIFWQCPNVAHLFRVHL